VERDGHENRGAAAERFLGEDGGVALDHAGGLHSFDAPMAGRRREADFLGERSRGGDAVALKLDQDFVVEFIERNGRIVRLRHRDANNYASDGRKPGKYPRSCAFFAIFERKSPRLSEEFPCASVARRKSRSTNIASA